MFEKLVIVSRKTRLEDLIARFNSRAQAKFYIEHAGGDFVDYEREDAAYRASLDRVRRGLDLGLKMQVMDRSFVPTYQFDARDLVVAVGQDGLVANTAKYVGDQPIVGVNPDPGRFDGVLLPFLPDQARPAVERVLEGTARLRAVTLAEAAVGDQQAGLASGQQAGLASGQRLVAFNDLFIGAKTHVSARYRIAWGGREEHHSSSGVIVSTGAGSTGWLSSVFHMAAAVASFTRGGAGPEEAREAGRGVTLAWEDPRLVFVVREPFVSRHSSAGVAMGMIEAGQELVLESHMPSGGVIFSDGVEADFLDFNSGAIARIRAAGRKARLVVN